MEKQGLGIRGWGLGMLLATGLAMNGTTISFAEEKPKDAGEVPAVTVRAFNYAEATRRELEEAKDEAVRIFARIGVRVVWLECRFAGDDLESPPACEEPLAPSEFVLRVLPSSNTATAPIPSGHGMLGVSVVAGGRGFLASVFFDRVRALAAKSDASRGAVLGHAAAHEIGHLLFGTNQHSRRGLMRAHWDDTDLFGVSQRSLRFTPPESALIRAKVMQRIEAGEEARLLSAASRK